MDSPDETSKIVHWTVELTGNMTRLYRDGWKADSIKPGETIIVNGYRARRIPTLMNANEVTKNGKKYREYHRRATRQARCHMFFW